MYSFSILIGSYVNNMSQIILVIADVILGCMLFSICNIGMEVVLIEPLILLVVKYDIMILFQICLLNITGM